MSLDKSLSAKGIGLCGSQTKCGSEGLLVSRNGLERREQHSTLKAVSGSQVGGTADVTQGAHSFAGGGPASYLQQRGFAHAEDEKIGLAVDQNRAAHRIVPEIVMRQPPQTRFDAADNHRQPLEGPLDRRGIGNDRAIGPGAGFARPAYRRRRDGFFSPPYSG